LFDGLLIGHTSSHAHIRANRLFIDALFFLARTDLPGAPFGLFAAGTG
jgi:hypothetical protein